MAELLTTAEWEKIRHAIEIVRENGLSELSLTETDGFAVTLKTSPVLSFPEPVALPVYAPMQAIPAPVPVSPSPAAVPSANTIALEAPMVGVFYAAPSPGEPPFLAVGDLVKPGQTIGLIEAMKVFSEVPAEAGGRVVQIVVKDGSLVQRGQPLITLEPL